MSSNTSSAAPASAPAGDLSSGAPRRLGLETRRRAALMLWDALVAFGSVIVFGGGPAAAAALAGVAAPLGIGAVGGYAGGRTPFGAGSSLVARLALPASLCVWSAWLVGALADGREPTLGLAAVGAALPVAWMGGRLAARIAARRSPERVLLVGSGRVAEHVVALSFRHPEARLRILGFLDDDPLPTTRDVVPHLGPVDALLDVVRDRRIERVIVCFSNRGDEFAVDVVRGCEALGVEVDVVPRFFELVGATTTVSPVGDFPLLVLRDLRASWLERAAKRTIDLAGAFLLLTLSAPAMLAAGAAIKLEDGGPVLYRSVRVGRHGRHYTMLKMRTMSVGADRHEYESERAEALVSGNLKPQRDPRITRVGRRIRALSLDEFPQLLNVLAGHMSLVGPRPVLPNEAHGVCGWQRGRYEARPGITGLWQVLGRSDIAWSERMHLDCSYTRHWSLAYDLRILARTVAVVFSRSGAC